MIYLMAFLVGGAICALGQIILDVIKLAPIYITSLFVGLGAMFDTFGLYDKLVEKAGAGATIPISSFGHSLVHAALEKSQEVGYIGILTGVFNLTAAGIAASIIFAFFIALIFRPKG
ncbi:MAG: stage V sporulation protein AE [Bacillota bacterium]|jgi:stage V sporulation protein AE|nr:stage V sporulation protein AE [Bacillota bacterium]NLM32021.1 stage V sporulation protein AE [Acholeplasmataceae bacterium]HOA78276.1 stage V sporulation protein AE [Bacilli bacterium]HPZ26995.1 stage V sporulation protein AE [Bacilli bacterium]HQC89401.1 stage V sporulation protein AE [Bacilli bacterium]